MVAYNEAQYFIIIKIQFFRLINVFLFALVYELGKLIMKLGHSLSKDLKLSY